MALFGRFRSGFNGQLLVIGTIFVLSFLTFYVLFQAASAIEYIREIIAALIATILTVTITTMLLKAQTTSEELKERNVEVFRKKVEIYDRFLRNAIDHLDDNELDEREARQIRKDTYHLALFSTEDTVETVAQFLRSHVLNDVEPVSFLEIVSAFRSELNLAEVGPLTGADLEAVDQLFRSGFEHRAVFRAIRTSFGGFVDRLRAAFVQAGLEHEETEIIGVTDRVSVEFTSGRGCRYVFELCYPPTAGFESLSLERFVTFADATGPTQGLNQKALELGFVEKEYETALGTTEQWLLKRTDLQARTDENGHIVLGDRGVVRSIVSDVQALEGIPSHL